MKMRNLFYAFVIFGQVIFIPGLVTAEEPNSSPPKGEVSPLGSKAARPAAKADMPGQEKEKAMTVKLQWFGHASFKITDGNTVIYIDPWKLKEAGHDATIVLVSHSHFDHFSAPDIEKVSNPNTRLVAAGDVIAAEGKGDVLKPGQTLDISGVRVTGVPAYNPAKKFHPKANNWLGFVIETGGKRIYYSGDSDETPEMDALKNIDLALLPVGGTYTMDANDAANATKQFKPKRAIPYHWGDIVGSRADADNFAKKAGCPVTVLKPGESTPVE